METAAPGQNHYARNIPVARNAVSDHWRFASSGFSSSSSCRNDPEKCCLVRTFRDRSFQVLLIMIIFAHSRAPYFPLQEAIGSSPCMRRVTEPTVQEPRITDRIHNKSALRRHHWLFQLLAHIPVGAVQGGLCGRLPAVFVHKLLGLLNGQNGSRAGHTAAGAGHALQ